MGDSDAASCPIHNELLCFVSNKSSVLPVDGIVDLCADFYKAEEIEQARCILASYLQNQRLPKHKGAETDKKRRTLVDIVKACLDPSVNLPVFYAVDLARLPPVGAQHVDICALLQEVAALRAEVRAAVAIKEELVAVKAAVMELTSPPVPTLQQPSTIKTAATVLKETISTGGLHNAIQKEDKTRTTGASAPRRRPQPIVGSSSTNSHVKGVETVRTVEIFVSRLHPATARNELVDCVNTIKGDLVVQNIECEKLKVVHEHLYSSFRVAITVGTASFHRAIGLFTAAEAWPTGVYIRRFYKPKSKNESN